ncbi:putative ribonuclease H-like domain-containing protein [Tanacetum coccineum]
MLTTKKLNLVTSNPLVRRYYDVKTFGVKNMTTIGTRAIVGKGKVENVLKKAKWVWRPKMNYQDHVYKYNGSYMLKKFEYGNPKILLQDHAVVDSGCSSHMTFNKAYLLDYKDLNRGFVALGSDPKGGKIMGKGKIKTANLDFDDVYFVDELKFNLFSVSQMCDKKNSVLFTESECLILSPSFKLLDESQVVLRAPRKDGVYSLDLKNIVPSGGITCLYANATADESKLWHRRLGHVNFKNINKLVKGHLVRGLPSKVFVNDHTCVACKKGKQHKASCKAKLDRIIRKPLELLHMDLFGPVSIESINKKRYCLVVTDDFSRFSWVFFLATKDETSEILCNLIIERKNRTLIEAARTMLADSLLPIPFWAEAVNTACYVLNRFHRKDKGPTQEYILLPLQPHRTRIPVKDVEEQHQMQDNEKDLQDELEMLVTQELVAKAMEDVSRQAFEEEKRRIASQKKAAQATSTNQLSTDRLFVSTDRSNTPNVSAASTSTDASDTLPNDGIFNGAYDDDEDVGAVANFNNMDNTIAVSPIPTLRIHKDHPKGQILGDPTLAVQTRGKI